jgi:hypothetical protein
MLAQPGPLKAPVRAVPLEKRPERGRVIWDAQVAELVDNHVVDHGGRRQQEPPVEGKRACPGARAPQSPLGSDPDPPVGDADPPCLLEALRARCTANLWR